MNLYRDLFGTKDVIFNPKVVIVKIVCTVWEVLRHIVQKVEELFDLWSTPYNL